MEDHALMVKYGYKSYKHPYFIGNLLSYKISLFDQCCVRGIVASRDATALNVTGSTYSTKNKNH